MTEDDLKRFLDDNAESIKAEVKRAAIAKLTSEYRWDISEQISKAVSAFVTDHVVPDVQAELMAQKGSIVGATVKALATLSDDLAKSLAQDAMKQIGNEWQRKAILKAIFGIH